MYVSVIFNNTSPSGGTNFKLQAERSYRVLTITISCVLSAFSLKDSVLRTTAEKKKLVFCATLNSKNDIYEIITLW